MADDEKNNNLDDENQNNTVPEKEDEEIEVLLAAEEAKNFSSEDANKALTLLYPKAEEYLNDTSKLEQLLLRIEEKLKAIPKIGEKLSEIPVFVMMIRSYIKKEYTEIPIGTLIAIIAALLYFISPVDLIPDVIPGAGYIDDAAVVGACLLLVESDVLEYQEWRKTNK